MVRFLNGPHPPDGVTLQPGKNSIVTLVPNISNMHLNISVVRKHVYVEVLRLEKYYVSVTGWEHACVLCGHYKRCVCSTYIQIV